jgi:hypothetical protein
VAATAVYAGNKHCTSKPCRGTNLADILYERNGEGVPDAIYDLDGGRGFDTCNGELGADFADVAVNCEAGNLAND